MPAVDIHTHLPARSDVTDPRVLAFMQQQGVELSAEPPVDRLLQEMERGGIDRAVVLGSPSHAGIETDNERLARTIEPHADRLIGFGLVDPHRDSDPAGVVRRCVEELGFRGVGEFGLLDVSDPACFVVYEVCIDLGIPILFHQGTTLPTTPLRHGHPAQLDEVAIRYPELTIIAAHCGAPWSADLAAVAVRHPNVWIDVSALPVYPYPVRLQALLTMLSAGLGCRLLFGSDFPLVAPSSWVGWIRSFRVPWVARLALKVPGLTPAERSALLWENAAALLGLQLA